MTTKQTKQIEKYKEKIDVMDLTELRSFAQNFYLSKEDIDKEVFKSVENEMDKKIANLMEMTNITSNVETSEIKLDEL